MPKLKNKYELMIGDVFGKWTITGAFRDDLRKQHRWRFTVKCECGSKQEMAVHTLLKKRTTQCQQCSFKSRTKRT